MSADAETTAPKQIVGRPFQPGQSGNPEGRPKGSRNKLGEQFLSDLQADWEANGMAAIVAVREQKPDAYLKVVASILPKIIRVEDARDLTDDELTARIRQLAEFAEFALGSFEGTGEPPGREKAPARAN